MSKGNDDERKHEIIKPLASEPFLLSSHKELDGDDRLMLPLLDDEEHFPPPLDRDCIGLRQRSASLDNADISYRGPPLDHADVDDDIYSLPSMENLLNEGDEAVRLSSSGPAGLPPELLRALTDPSINDDTPAAAALRANAMIRVGKVGKLARSVHAQTVRRLVKRATMRGKSGYARGKPPRIPPPRESEEYDDAGAAAPSDVMFVVEEGDEVEQDQLSSHGMSAASIQSDSSFEHNEFTGAVAAGATQNLDREDVGHRIVRELEKVPNEMIAAGRKVMKAVEEQDGRRKRRRRSGRRERNKSYVKGKVITREHELYTLSIAVMLGIRTSIGATNAKMNSSQARRRFSSEDFMESAKYEFSPKGGPKTPPHKLSHTFKFKDYAPVAFAYLRRMFGVNEFEFLLSVCGNANFIEFISNAKSGQFFFYSSDGKYMIKTMTNAESKFLRRILPHYFRHCAQNPNTFLTKFLGMYRVKMYHLRRNVKFVIMNSVYYTDKPLQSFYDLKGSVLGREAKPHQDVKKDNDLRRGLPDTAIALPPAVRGRVRAQMVADCEFMRKMEIMDYSMLIGIHHVPPTRTERKTSMGLTTSKSRSDGHSHNARDSFRELLRNRAVQASPGPHSMPTQTPTSISPKPRTSPRGPVHRSAPAPSTPLSDHQGNGQPDKANEVAHVTPAVSFEEPSEAGDMPNGVPESKSDIQGSGIPEEFQYYLSDLQDYEHGFDEDDDSYLEGSEHHLQATAGSAKLDEVTVQKERTIEKIYWPFHRLYDIHGYRRLVPGPCLTCKEDKCTCAASGKSLAGWDISSFVRPLSDRKDGGLQADMTDVDVPQTFKAHGQEIRYEGKIFYMGIIDVLQQYNMRKRIEAKYRRVQGSGWEGASCVHPDIYAERFVRFFDEYSQRRAPVEDGQLADNGASTVRRKQD